MTELETRTEDDEPKKTSKKRSTAKKASKPAKASKDTAAAEDAAKAAESDTEGAVVSDQETDANIERLEEAKKTEAPRGDHEENHLPGPGPAGRLKLPEDHSDHDH